MGMLVAYMLDGSEVNTRNEQDERGLWKTLLT